MIFYILGAVFALIGISTLVKTLKIKKEYGLNVEAEVISVDEETYVKSDTDSTLLYRYTPKLGYRIGDEEFSGMADISTDNKEKYKIGDKIRIHCATAVHSVYTCKNNNDKVITGILILVIAAAFIVVGKLNLLG